MRAQSRAQGNAEPRFLFGSDITFRIDRTDVAGTRIGSLVVKIDGNAAQGFTVRLDIAEHAYWFEVVDQQAACGFRFISNEQGLIFKAQPIR